MKESGRRGRGSKGRWAKERETIKGKEKLNRQSLPRMREMVHGRAGTMPGSPLVRVRVCWMQTIHGYTDLTLHNITT